MWTVYDRRAVQVVGADELDLRRVINKGDKIIYGSYYCNNINNGDSDCLPRMTGIVLSVHRYFAIVKTQSGRTDTANWYDITAIGRHHGDMMVYSQLMRING